MPRITDLDVMEIRQVFEDALSRAQNADKREKMRFRRKIRDEVYLLLTWEKPTPTAIINRWEERLHDVFKVMPYGFTDELLRLLTNKMQHPLKMRTQSKSN